VAFGEEPQPGTWHAQAASTSEVQLFEHNHRLPDVGDIAHQILTEGEHRFCAVKVEFAPDEEEPHRGVLSVTVRTPDCEIRDVWSNEQRIIATILGGILVQSDLAIGNEVSTASVIEVPWQ